MKKLLLMTLVASVVAFPLGANAQQLFDFNGQTLLPAGPGSNLTMYSKITNNGIIDTPLPLDYANFEYTLVITNLTLIADGASQSYAGGTITLYEDAATAADYTNPATFTDGTALLVGTVSLSRQMMLPSLGSVAGDVDWTGGTRLGDFAPADRTGWKIFSAVSNRSTVTQPGYNENWDGKVEPSEPVVEGDRPSVGEVKSRF